MRKEACRRAEGANAKTALSGQDGGGEGPKPGGGCRGLSTSAVNDILKAEIRRSDLR